MAKLLHIMPIKHSTGPLMRQTTISVQQPNMSDSSNVSSGVCSDLESVVEDLADKDELLSRAL